MTDISNIIQEHQAIIFKISSLYSNSEEERKDLQQDIVYHICKGYPKFNQNSKVSTWIYRVALNTAITHLRKSKRKFPSIRLEDSHHDIADTNPWFDFDEESKKIYALIRQLNDLDKTIMFLYLDDNSYEDIARIVGISESNVGTKISRLKKQVIEAYHQLKE